MTDRDDNPPIVSAPMPLVVAYLVTLAMVSAICIVLGFLLCRTDPGPATVGPAIHGTISPASPTGEAP